MGYTRYYTLCKDEDYVLHVLRLILHHNTAKNEDVGEPLNNVKYIEIDDSMVAMARKEGQYQTFDTFQKAKFILIYDNSGGRNSTRPFFEERGVNPDCQYIMPDEVREMIRDREDLPWTIVTPYINIYKEGGLEKLNACLQEHIDQLSA